MTEANAVTSAGAIVIPEAAERRRPASTLEECDAALELVASRRKEWIATPAAARVRILDEVIASTMAVAERWAAAEAELKGIPAGSAYDGETMAWGPYMPVRICRLLKKSLTDIAKHGAPRLPGRPLARPDGQVVVPVFPATKLDRLLFPMTTGELWLEPDVTLGTVEQAKAYREPGDGELCLVLGAGNAGAVPVLDLLYQFFVHNRVCVLKMNPANEVLGPILQLALAPLVRDGFLRILYGGAEVGAHLTGHDLVDHLHMTGSDKTHDAIVYGTGEEGARRKAADEPVNDKPFTAELGSVSPVIVVPGEWSDDELEYQAKHVHMMINVNSGFTCGALRVLVTWEGWPQRDAFLAKLREVMAAAEGRAAFYPGAKERWDAFTAAHDDAVHHGEATDDHVPVTMLPGLDPSDDDEIAFRVESFNAVFGETAISGGDPAEYLRRAVAFCNDTLWGTLGATLLVHPKSRKDPLVDRAVEQAIADLRYGAVAVNAWALLSYGYGATTWGAFPGHARNDIQTGRGQVGNVLMVEGVQKSVVRAPWRLGKKPPQSHDFTAMPSLAPRLLRLEAYGDLTQVPGIVLDGIKG